MALVAITLLSCGGTSATSADGLCSKMADVRAQRGLLVTAYQTAFAGDLAAGYGVAGDVEQRLTAIGDSLRGVPTSDLASAVAAEALAVTQAAIPLHPLTGDPVDSGTLVDQAEPAFGMADELIQRYDASIGVKACGNTVAPLESMSWPAQPRPSSSWSLNIARIDGHLVSVAVRTLDPTSLLAKAVASLGVEVGSISVADVQIHDGASDPSFTVMRDLGRGIDATSRAMQAVIWPQASSSVTSQVAGWTVVRQSTPLGWNGPPETYYIAARGPLLAVFEEITADQLDAFLPAIWSAAAPG